MSEPFLQTQGSGKEMRARDGSQGDGVDGVEEVRRMTFPLGMAHFEETWFVVLWSFGNHVAEMLLYHQWPPVPYGLTS